MTHDIPGKVLLVDDDIGSLKLMSFYIKRKFPNVEIQAFTSPVEALKTVGNGYDLVVADCLMDEMDGGEFASALKSNGLSTPILMVTASDRRALEVAGNGTIEAVIEKGREKFLARLDEQVWYLLSLVDMTKKVTEMHDKLQVFARAGA